MVVSKDLLFIHVPKTGGTSCTDYLCRYLEKPVFLSSLKFQLAKKHFNASLFPGYSHETLSEAYANYKNILSLTGIDVRKITNIISVIRDPISLELSTYNFYRNGNNNILKGQVFQTSEVRERIDLAQGDLVSFIRKSGYFRKDKHGEGVRIEDYLLIDGALPKELILLKMENLDADFTRTVRPFLRADHGVFKRANVSRNYHITAEDLTAEACRLIYKKHQWIYDNGYYEIPV